jgi:hypothetical protein
MLYYFVLVIFFICLMIFLDVSHAVFLTMLGFEKSDKVY